MTYTDQLARDKRRALWVTAVLFVVITVLTLAPMKSLPPAPGSDKLHHFIAFGILAVPLSWAWPRHVLSVVLGVAIYAVAIEVVQPYVGRFGEVRDALAGSIGAVLGGGLGGAVGTLRTRHINREA